MLAVAYDSFELLRMISVGRIVMNGALTQLLEDIFLVYQAGFYPCGISADGHLVAFDVRTLR